MRRAVFALLPLLFAPSAFADDCTKDVVAAFEKQRTTKAFRVAMSQPTAEGPVEMTVDYMPPDRMLQTVVAPHMPGDQQTMLVGNRAYAGSGGTFEELLPQFTQSIVTEFKTAVHDPLTNLGSFRCLGKQTYEGKELMAYRTQDAAAAASGKTPADTLGRTIYIDTATGLPAYNVVSTEAPGSDPVMKAAYTYPDDIDIVAPANAPVQKPQN